jgi:hypothetical protein
MQDDRYLDDAIDRTVRDMMDVDPAPGLSRRVLARIDEPATRRAFASPRLAVLTALGAAVVVLAIAMLFRSAPHDPPRIAATPRSQPTDQPLQRLMPDPTQFPLPPPVSTRTATPSRRAANVDRLMEAASLARDTDVVIAPLGVMDPIRFAPVGPQTIVVATIGIDPIQVAPLKMDLLSSTPQ